jgi:hypothetical protein
MNGASQYRLRVRMKTRSSEKKDMASSVQQHWRMVRSYARLSARTQVVTYLDI